MMGVWGLASYSCPAPIKSRLWREVSPALHSQSVCVSEPRLRVEVRRTIFRWYSPTTRTNSAPPQKKGDAPCPESQGPWPESPRHPPSAAIPKPCCTGPPQESDPTPWEEPRSPGAHLRPPSPDSRMGPGDAHPGDVTESSFVLLKKGFWPALCLSRHPGPVCHPTRGKTPRQLGSWEHSNSSTTLRREYLYLYSTLPRKNHKGT